MFNRYWRSYPWWMQLILFVLMVFVFLSLAQVLAYVLVPRLTGVGFEALADLNAKSSVAVVKASLIVQVLSAIFLFLLPSLLFAQLAHPRPLKYLGLVKPGRAIQPLLAIVAMVTAIPLILSIASVVHLIDLGAKANAIQARNEEVTKMFMNLAPQIGFFPVLFVMAILPGIAEELFFRGILLRFARKRSMGMVVPVALSSIAFALAHQTPYSFLSIFFSGVLLAIIYYLTRSIWCGILAHMSFNGIQISLEYFSTNNATIKAVLASNSVPLSLLLASTLVSALAFYLLWKYRTPLPDDWASDYTKEELSEKAV